MKKKRYFSRTVCFLLCAVFALLFLLPTVLTITNSFMTQSEITASYGQVFENANDGKSYISKTIELKFIPDKVSFTQYFTVLLKSPDYLLKFWNSVILTAPIVFAAISTFTRLSITCCLCGTVIFSPSTPSSYASFTQRDKSSSFTQNGTYRSDSPSASLSVSWMTGDNVCLIGFPKIPSRCSAATSS